MVPAMVLVLLVYLGLFLFQLICSKIRVLGFVGGRFQALASLYLLNPDYNFELTLKDKKVLAR